MLRLLAYMNIMGSLFFILRKILLPFERKYMLPKYSVFLCRLNLMFFIIPFPTCLFYLRRYFDDFVSNIPVLPFLYNGTHLIVHFEQNMNFALPKLNIFQLLILLLWIIVMVRQYKIFAAKNKRIREFNTFLQIFGDEGFEKSPFKVKQLVHTALKELKIKNEPRVFVHESLVIPHINGIFHITLCLPCYWDVSEKVYYMAIKHELAHIRHKDLIFQRIAIFARIISWFNPFLYALCKNMDYFEELAADACACKGASLEERKAYQLAILDLSMKLSHMQDMPIKTLGFKRKNKKLTIERILAIGNRNIYKHKKLKAIAVTIISIVLFSLSIIPALAYNLPSKLKSENLNVHSIDMVRVDSLPLENESALYSSTQELESKLYSYTNNLDFTKSDWYCINENTSIDIQSYAKSYNIHCSHYYINAYIVLHRKNSNESCIMDYYNAKRCTKCNYIIEKEHIASTTFDICPH